MRISPPVRKLIDANGLSVDDIEGSGANGAITISDVHKHLQSEKSGKGKNIEAPPAASGYRNRDDVDSGRSTLHHLKEDNGTITRDGMTFRRPDRGTLDFSMEKKLDIPKKYLNNDLNYRWVVDNGSRVERLREQGGYATVPKITTPDGDTIETRRRSGTNEDGSAQYMQLVACPKEWKAERDKAKEDMRRQKEIAQFSGPIKDESGVLGENEYYRSGKSEIKKV